jgi:hypothetical protein
MDRVKFVASLDEDTRRRFINNCVDCNDSPDFFGRWLNDEKPATAGIGGAFVWSTTREGHDYWARVEANIKYEEHEV